MDADRTHPHTKHTKHLGEFGSLVTRLIPNINRLNSIYFARFFLLRKTVVNAYFLMNYPRDGVAEERDNLPKKDTKTTQP